MSFLHPPPETTASSSTTTTTITTDNNSTSYGSINATSRSRNDTHQNYIIEDGDDDDDFDDVEDDDDDDYSDDDDDDALLSSVHGAYGRGQQYQQQPSHILICWDKIKRFFFVLVNVDNIWDSPSVDGRDGSSGSGDGGPAVISAGRKWAVFFWFLVLAVAYATERASFKLLVDRAGPFRLLYTEAITGVHALVLGVGILASAIVRGKFEMKGLGLPLADIGIMAVLDASHLLFSMVSGSYVKPVLSVILIQFTIPLSVCMTKCTEKHSRHPDDTSENLSIANVSPNSLESSQGNGAENNSSSVTQQHLFGASIIFLAVIFGLSPSLIELINPTTLSSDDNVTAQTSWNTLIFTLSCIPAAASTLYKERTLYHYKQPVDPNMLNFLLSIFQFIFAALVSPLLYSLQGIGMDTFPNAYPSLTIHQNAYDAFQCFLAKNNDPSISSSYPETPKCHFTALIVLVHVLSIVTLTLSIDKIVHAKATAALYRGISAGIILAVVLMYIYEFENVDMNYGPAAHGLHAVCTLILILGSELYHRVSRPDQTFETVYPEVPNLYTEE